MYIFGKEHLATKQNILKDNIGFVSIYDFSRANSSLEARIHAITSVASICYAKPDAVDKVSLDIINKNSRFSITKAAVLHC